MENLGKTIDVKTCVSYTAAAAANATGAEVDMQGYEGVIFIVGLGTSAVDNGIKAQQDTVTGMGNGADLLGSQVLLDGTETIAIVEIHKPRERFLRPIVVRGTSTTIEWCIAIKYGAHKRPVDLNALADVAYELHVSPAEGTA